MAVKVHLDHLLSRRAGTSTVEANGTTVREIVDDLDRQYPGLRSDVFGGGNELRDSLAVFVNGYLAGLADPIADGAEVEFTRAISGG
jgi:sulfur-carrier protein